MIVGSAPVAGVTLGGSYTGTAAPEIHIEIAGISRSEYVDESLRIDESVSRSNIAKFKLRDTTQTYRPDIGDHVRIMYDRRLFEGTIDKIDEKEPVEGKRNEIEVTCLDYNQLARRFLIAADYAVEGQTLQDIVLDIVGTQTPLVDDEGITTAKVEEGPTIDPVLLDYKTVEQALDELSRLTGYLWNITYDKELEVYAIATRRSAWSITTANQLYRSVRVKQDRGKYRNIQYVRAGFQLTNERQEVFVGDGENRNFQLRFEVAKGTVPTFEVNIAAGGWVTKTAGVNGVDEGLDWYYEEENKEFSQDDDGTVLTTSDKVRVTYIGQFATIAVDRNDAQVLARQSVEGGTGIYENIEVDEDIERRQIAIDKAESLLDRFGVIPQEVEIETYQGSSILCGDVIDLDLTAQGIDNDYLIESKRTVDLGQGHLRYTITATRPIAEGESWVEFFKKQWEVHKRVRVSRGSEKIVILRKIEDEIGFDDTVSTSTNPATLNSVDYDPYTAPRIGEIDSKDAMVIGFALIGPHPLD